LRVGFAAGGLHDLADQEVEGAFLAAPVLRRRGGIGREDVADELLPPDEQGDEVRFSEGASYLLPGVGHGHLFSSLGWDRSRSNRMHAL
jgi:hypothetical protein